MINGKYAYVIFMTYRLHFSSSDYNIADYNFKYITRLSANYDKRPDKHFFERLAGKYPKEEDWVKFCVANLLHKPDGFIGDFSGEEGRERYIKLCGRLTDIPRLFKKDISYICRKIVIENIKFNKSFVDLVWNMMYNDKISIETFIIIRNTFKSLFDTNLNDLILYKYSYKYRIDAYETYLRISNFDVYKYIFENTFKEEYKNWKNTHEENDIAEIELI